ncbi:hypothetical protein FQN60_013884 [Etheostoma spectabile]|uniref:Uncharacterized protein n=1 Tax=Etheostoma spectabile TaxID=54343 RepID=A0A5J5CK66_9PERO|nr:hypothetical protein FQN60_013884 [Etheostoma spectabile]
MLKTLTWNLQQDPPNNITENTDQPSTTKIQKTITLSDTLMDSPSAVRPYPVNEGRGVRQQRRERLSVSLCSQEHLSVLSPSGLFSSSWVTDLLQ